MAADAAQFDQGMHGGAGLLRCSRRSLLGRRGRRQQDLLAGLQAIEHLHAGAVLQPGANLARVLLVLGIQHLHGKAAVLAFVYLHFTDGFAAGVVAAGNVLRGANGNAGELGRLLAMAGLPRPSIEDLRSRLVAAGHDLPNLGSLLQRYDPSWPQIEEWIADVAGSITLAIAAAIALIDPRAIVFGARLPIDLAQRLIATVKFEQHPRRGVSSPLPALLTHSVLRQASTMGAAALPLKAHYFA